MISDWVTIHPYVSDTKYRNNDICNYCKILRQMNDKTPWAGLDIPYKWTKTIVYDSIVQP